MLRFKPTIKDFYKTVFTTTGFILLLPVSMTSNAQVTPNGISKAQADYIERECRGYEGLGQEAAKLRQSGVSQEKALALAKYTNQKHQSMRPDRKNDIQLINNVFVLIIEDAYAQPIYPTQAEKQKEIQYRGNRAYGLCKEALPLGIVEGKKLSYTKSHP